VASVAAEQVWAEELVATIMPQNMPNNKMKVECIFDILVSTYSHTKLDSFFHYSIFTLNWLV
jgi:hypothetical protein